MLKTYGNTLALAGLIIGLFVWLRNDITNLRTQVDTISTEVASLTTNIENLEARVVENSEKIGGNSETVAENARVIANINGRLGEAIASLPKALQDKMPKIPVLITPPAAIVTTPDSD